LISVFLLVSNTKDDVDGVQINLKLLGDHLWNSCICALPHFCPVVQNGDFSGTVD
jgi:hypothetical protein